MSTEARKRTVTAIIDRQMITEQAVTAAGINFRRRQVSGDTEIRIEFEVRSIDGADQLADRLRHAGFKAIVSRGTEPERVHAPKGEEVRA